MIEIIVPIGIGLGAIAIASMLYKIVPPTEAHLVVTPSGRIVISPDEQVATDNRRTYFAFPNWIPFIGRVVRVMDVTTKELIGEQETYEKGQARYNVKWSLKYRITDVRTASETFINDTELREQLKEVVESSVRATTVLYDVTDARAKKKEIEQKVNEEMIDDLHQWGLKLINFQLVDFRDTGESQIISDISRRREVEIESITREQNAEKIKQARVKEAESDEVSKQREIVRNQVVAEQEEIQRQKVAEQKKIAEQKAYEVLEVQTVRQAEIEKQKAIVEAEQKERTEEILRRQKKLEGEGDRLRAEEIAKGEAAPILEKGLAEAKAKDALQEALNKFKEDAIRALVAEKIVDKDREVGVATAEAFSKADIKAFLGGGDSKSGFDLAALIESAKTGSFDTADSVLNKIARPHDLGFTALGAQKAKEIAETQIKINKNKKNKNKRATKK
jgi:flotillin